MGATTVPLMLVVPPPGQSAPVVTVVGDGTSAATSIWVEQDAASKVLAAAPTIRWTRVRAASQTALGRAEVVLPRK